MNQYLQIAKNTWDEAVTYRTSFILYRFREVLQLLSMYFLWYFVSHSQQGFFDYTQSSILTYVLISAFVGDIVFATRTTAIASEINEGVLTNFLLRPMSYLRYHFARDIGDKALNISFSLIELFVVFLILQPPFQFQTEFITNMLFIVSVLLAVILHFFISVLIAFVGFWSNEGWGPRFIFYQAIGFFSGGLFPLDILPFPIFTAFQFLPFSYLTYFPAKIYLGNVSQTELIQGFLIQVCWIFIMYKLVMIVWRKGLRSYTAQGR
jgi:ABC-2 type transport system permease protein